MHYKLKANKKTFELLMDGHFFLKEKLTTIVKFPIEEEVEELILKTGQTLKSDLGFHTKKALALCASQVGLPYRFFVMINFKMSNPYSNLQYIINPKVLKFNPEMIIYEEGCLSIPEILIDMERHNELEVQYQNLNGKVINRTVKGEEAVCFQHEYDHLNGILMKDRSQHIRATKANNEYFKYLAMLENSKNK